MSIQNQYAPSFVIYSDGIRISTEAESGLKKIVISDNLNDAGGFKIRFNDHDFKLQKNNEISIGTELKISTGYKDNAENIITADITGLSIDTDFGSGTDFIIHGKNKLHRLNYSSDYLNFRKLRTEEIIRKLLSKAGFEAAFDSVSFDKRFISFKYKNDFDFIKNISTYHDLIFYVRDKTFHLKKRQDREQEDIVLEYGKTVIDLTVDTDISGLITELEVKNYNYNKKKLEFKRSFAERSDEIIKKIGCDFNSKAVLIDKGIVDEKSADEISTRILSRNGRGVKKFYGTVPGNNKIRAGSLLKFNNAGENNSGICLVKKAVHEISEKGYITGFYCEN